MADAEDTLRAIGAGEVDAFIVSGMGAGHRVFTMSTADLPYRMFVENMHDGAATLSSSGVILYANRRLATLLSCPRESIVGSPLTLFMPADSPIDLAQLRDPGALSGALEMDLIDAQGTAIPVLIGTSFLESNGDRLTCLTFADLSAQRAQDREIARLNQAQVERMADLQAAQAALTKVSERARDQAVAESEMKSQFLATMSHEIRTPMNGVIGLASLLLGTDLDATQVRYAAGLHTAGNALLGVINDILDFSKIEANKLVLDIGDFDLSATLVEVGSLINPAAQHRGLTMVTRADPNLPAMVRGDSGRVRQILLNLVGNAVKFTPRGSVTLRAFPDTIASDALELAMVRFEVSDTGIGIAAADAERLFEPFTQADASTTRAYGGTGLGLAICRQLTEALGGTIGVDSSPGEGSTFWCVIPFGRALDSSSRVAAPVPPPESRPAPPGPSYQPRLLLVEDNEINQMVAVGILTGSGYRITVANDGVEALDLAAAGTYDAILMDCRMPRMDGFNATRELRRREGDGRHTPIVAMTASALAVDREACLAAGMDDFLTKPISAIDLKTTLNRWIVHPAVDIAAHDPGNPAPVPIEPDGDPLACRLAELRNTNTEPERLLVNRLITSFLERAPRYLTTLTNAVTAADAAAVEAHAHSFKGAAGNIGAVGAAQICDRLETLGHGGRLDPTAIDDLHQLRTEIGAVDVRLRTILERHQTPTP